MADKHGLFLPVDPGADATLGGMAATNAAGTMTFAFGKMRSRVLALKAVLPGGRVIRTGSRAMKTSAGYDLTGLLVESEGTLAVITKLTLRLAPIPERVLALRASFPSVRAAASAAQDLVACAAGARRIELIDEWEIAALNRFRERNAVPAPKDDLLRELPLLLVEVAGAPQAAAAALVEVVEVISVHGAVDVVQAHTPPDCASLWRLRAEVFEADGRWRRAGVRFQPIRAFRSHSWARQLNSRARRSTGGSCWEESSVMPETETSTADCWWIPAIRRRCIG